MQSTRYRVVDDYKNQILACARIYYLLIASFDSERLVVHRQTSLAYMIDYENSHAYHYQFMSWLEQPNNENIKQIIQNFSQDFIWALTDATGKIHTDLFLEFKAVFSHTKIHRKNKHFSHGSLGKMCSFFLDNQYHPCYSIMLNFLDAHTTSLLWPASRWENDFGITRSLDVFEEYAGTIITKYLKKIAAKLNDMNPKNAFDFFFTAHKKQINLSKNTIAKVLKVYENPLSERETTEELFAFLYSFISDQIKLLNKPPEPQNLLSTLSLRNRFSKIYVHLDKLTLRLNVLAYLYHPGIEPFSEPMFNIKDLMSISAEDSSPSNQPSSSY